MSHLPRASRSKEQRLCSVEEERKSPMELEPVQLDVLAEEIYI